MVKPPELSPEAINSILEQQILLITALQAVIDSETLNSYASEIAKTASNVCYNVIDTLFPDLEEREDSIKVILEKLQSVEPSNV